MRLIDSHCHLYLEEFENDIQEVIQRAMDQGVDKFFLPNIDSSTTDSMNGLASKYPDNCFPMMGLHPTSVKENFKAELEHVRAGLESGKYKGVGEIGIDLYWDKAFIKEQVEAFETQIEWAKEFSLPIIIHARDSFPEIFASVDKLNDDKLTGIFHCFSGTLEDAKHIMNYGGFKMGIGGVVTFKNGKIDQFLDQVPLENLVLETDSPYLAPVPYRGKRNESSYLKEIVKKLSSVYSVSEEIIAEQTTRNSLEIFQLS